MCLVERTQRDVKTTHSCNVNTHSSMYLLVCSFWAHTAAIIELDSARVIGTDTGCAWWSWNTEIREKIEAMSCLCFGVFVTPEYVSLKRGNGKDTREMFRTHFKRSLWYTYVLLCRVYDIFTSEGKLPITRSCFPTVREGLENANIYAKRTLKATKRMFCY